ncbi:MAG: hypothetical protein SWX82_01615 [Cyanobacteriota bacterium]|nr:hypothetical protein [Cyanobacteriota bacterium]
MPFAPTYGVFKVNLRKSCVDNYTSCFQSPLLPHSPTPLLPY